MIKERDYSRGKPLKMDFEKSQFGPTAVVYS